MKQPKVSIIVPVYKVEKYLVQCLDSIVGQTLKDIEIIIVDEGDKDACRYIIDHYEQADKRVIAIHEKNGSYGASVNKGLAVAKGEYIGIVESDDFIAPEMYEEMYNYAKKLNADVVKTPYFQYWDKTKDKDEIIGSCSTEKWTQKLPENRVFSATDYPVITGIHPSIWSAIYKRAFLLKNKITCIECRGAGYVDNPFRIETIMSTSRLAWLNKKFYYYRLSNPDASVANFNISNMIKRWIEIHDLFKTKFFDSYEKVAPYLIREEHICTFEKILRFGETISSEQYKALKHNLDFTNKKIIENAPTLSLQQKKELLSLKKDFNILLKKSPEKNSPKTREIQTTPSSKYKICLLKIPLLTIKNKKNKQIYLLLGFIPLLTIKKTR